MDRDARSVLVRGTNDVGSAVAVVLVKAGFRVALHDQPFPTTTRRGMALADAVFDGTAMLESVHARRIAMLSELEPLWALREVPVFCGSFDEILHAADWLALVDARMRKHSVPERQRGVAPLTIGLGPNFVAGDTVDVAIETSWGDRLGAIVLDGPTLPLEGEPQVLGGIGRARFVYAPVAGRFRTAFGIGDRIQQGSLVATIDGHALLAPVEGSIRGLTHDGVPVAVRTKVVEVDPGGNPENAFGLGARPRRIAEGVLAVVSQALAQGGLSQAPAAG
jgi:xanthine dehydrogenase accessory factor